MLDNFSAYCHCDIVQSHLLEAHFGAAIYQPAGKIAAPRIKCQGNATRVWRQAAWPV